MGFAQGTATVIAILAHVPSAMTDSTTVTSKHVISNIALPLKMAQSMRSALGMGAVTLKGEYALVKRAGLAQAARISRVLIAMASCIHMTLVMHAMDVEPVMWRLGSVPVLSHTMGTLVRSPSAQKIVSGSEAVMLRVASVPALKAAKARLVNSPNVPKIAMHLLVGTATG